MVMQLFREEKLIWNWWIWWCHSRWRRRELILHRTSSRMVNMARNGPSAGWIRTRLWAPCTVKMYSCRLRCEKKVNYLVLGNHSYLVGKWHVNISFVLRTIRSWEFNDKVECFLKDFSLSTVKNVEWLYLRYNVKNYLIIGSFQPLIEKKREQGSVH